MNTQLARLFLYTGTYLAGLRIGERLKELERTQFLTAQELQELQLNKLRRLVEHSYQTVPVFKQRMADRLLKPQQIKTFQDFAHIPMLTKEELRENAARMISSNPPTKLHVASTSGSTGIPLKFYRDARTFGYALAATYRGLKWHGIAGGAKEAMLWGVPVNINDRLKARIKDGLLNRFREKEYNITPEILYDFYSKVKRRRPVFLSGYTSMIYEFAFFLAEQSLDGRELGLKIAKCTSETIHEHQRQLIEKVFGCQVVSEYGSAETGIISFECEHRGHHLMNDCVYVEYVDEAGNPTKGEGARLLVTDLNNYTLPMIRYEIGDLGTPVDEKCGCGRGLPLIKNIVGRASNIAIGVNDKIYHSIIFYYIMKGFMAKGGGIKQFKVIQEAKDRLTFQIVKAQGFNESKINYIDQKIRSYFGERMGIDYQFAEAIPRDPSGKLKDFETKLSATAAMSKAYTPDPLKCSGINSLM